MGCWKNKLAISLLTPVLAIGLAACSGEMGATNAFKAGTYEGSGKGHNGDVSVQVELSEEAIKSVKVLDQNETEDIAAPAIEKIPQEIVDAQSTDVAVVSGATMSSNAIIEGTNAALKEAGVDPASLKKATEDTDTEAKTEEVDSDIVVVGAGAAGSAAALAAQQAGADVILLEKTASPMGAGTLAGGMFAADSTQQKEAGKEVDKEWMYNEYKTASQGHMDSILVRTIIDNAGETVDWLDENGAKMTLVEPGSGGSFEHVGMPATLHGYQEGGTKAITNLVETFEKAGGTAYFSTPATELIKDEESGVISGVKATKEDGTQLLIHAKKVILATGGFGGNQEMLDEYLGEPNTPGEVAQNTGDGINMAWDAGAGEKGVHTTHYFWQTFTPDEIGQMSDIVGEDWFGMNAFSSYPNLRVNINGQRFGDETDVTLYSMHGAEIAQQPKQTEYVIIDQQMLDTIKEKGTAGIEDQTSVFKDNSQFFMEFNEPSDTDETYERDHTPTDFTPLLDALVDTDVVFKSDDIAGLAKEMGVDETNFSAAVDQYNGAIEKGEDDLFFSDTDRLVKVAEGPFYGIKFVARNLGTLGGVRINEKIEAVTTDGDPIENLYVAGADAGGMYGSAYVDFEGGTLGFAYTSGRLAGINAAESISE